MIARNQEDLGGGPQTRELARGGEKLLLERDMRQVARDQDAIHGLSAHVFDRRFEDRRIVVPAPV
jgi:hypothetical protein